MVTLKSELHKRGYKYNTVFHHVAEDIYFDNTEELCFSLGYILRKIKRFDAEIPEGRNALLCSIIPNYPITNGLTSGGNQMKRAPQYRIYFHSIYNMPKKLKARLQNDNQNRITGSLFVEACMYIGFNPGSTQDGEQIKEAILEIFDDESEEKAFWDGYES